MEKRKIQMELKDGTKRDATYAEVSARLCVRDDKNMIYEMFELSQYSDGSVLNCQLMKTWTAQEVVEDAVESTMALSGG